jgi:hypothetical protein
MNSGPASCSGKKRCWENNPLPLRERATRAASASGVRGVRELRLAIDHKYTRYLIGAVSLAIVSLTVYGLGRSFFSQPILLGRPPCQSPGLFFVAAWWALPVAMLVGIWLQIRGFRRRKPLSIAIAVVVPLFAWSTYQLASKKNDQDQAACQNRPVSEAMRVCEANPKFYRAGKDGYGYDTLTLVAPGTTDKAWNCLYWWASWNCSTSIIVDKSVYDNARVKAGR